MPKKLTQEEFLKRARSIHGEKYKYPEEIQGVEHKMKIICPIHGEFYLTPHLHLRGLGCKHCNVKKKKPKGYNKKLNKELFVERAEKIHNHKYDYSKVNYINNSTKVCIICPEHGEFWQVPSSHLKGYGCNKCGKKITRSKKILSNDDFIKKARQIHGNRYDYSEIEYISFHVKIKIICPKHGEFWQTPAHHLQGEGCSECRNSLCENKIATLLEQNNISFNKEKTFEWLKNNNYLFLDFYLPDYNIAIECQGGQHVKPVEHFGGTEYFKSLSENDSIKYNLCQQHGIKIIYLFEKQFQKKCIDKKYENAIFYKSLDEITIEKLINYET